MELTVMYEGTLDYNELLANTDLRLMGKQEVLTMGMGGSEEELKAFFAEQGIEAVMGTNSHTDEAAWDGGF
jgi:hypothetical protein